jgi:hypothetical protein
MGITRPWVNACKTVIFYDAGENRHFVFTGKVH